MSMRELTTDPEKLPSHVWNPDEHGGHGELKETSGKRDWKPNAVMRRTRGGERNNGFALGEGRSRRLIEFEEGGSHAQWRGMWVRKKDHLRGF